MTEPGNKWDHRICAWSAECKQAESDLRDARAENAALRAQVNALRGELALFVPEGPLPTGPWEHGDGCPAEDATANEQCTCGAWGTILHARALLASTPEQSLAAVKREAVAPLVEAWNRFVAARDAYRNRSGGDIGALADAYCEAEKALHAALARAKEDR